MTIDQQQIQAVVRAHRKLTKEQEQQWKCFFVSVARETGLSVEEVAQVAQALTGAE